MAVFYQVAGTQVALPDYARTDLAFTSTQALTSPSAGLNCTYSVMGKYIEVPLAVSFLLTTDATIADRTGLVVYHDASGATIATLVAPTSTAATASVSFTFIVGSGVSYGPVGGQYVVPLPVYALLPSQSLVFGAGNLQATDQVSSVMLTTVKIPTGPALVAPSVTALTPQLV
jgi:hypothetical protein